MILANLCPTPSIQPPRSDVQKSDRSVQNSADGRGRNPRAGEAGRRPRQAERLREMHRGTRVSLHGLQSRPELNGQPATLILWDVSAHVGNTAARPSAKLALRGCSRRRIVPQAAPSLGASLGQSRSASANQLPMWKAAAQTLRPTRPPARPASARSRLGRPPASSTSALSSA